MIANMFWGMHIHTYIHIPANLLHYCCILAAVMGTCIFSYGMCQLHYIPINVPHHPAWYIGPESILEDVMAYNMMGGWQEPQDQGI